MWDLIGFYRALCSFCSLTTREVIAVNIDISSHDAFNDLLYCNLVTIRWLSGCFWFIHSWILLGNTICSFVSEDNVCISTKWQQIGLVVKLTQTTAEKNVLRRDSEACASPLHHNGPLHESSGDAAEGASKVSHDFLWRSSHIHNTCNLRLFIPGCIREFSSWYKRRQQEQHQSPENPIKNQAGRPVSLRGHPQMSPCFTLLFKVTLEHA